MSSSRIALAGLMGAGKSLAAQWFDRRGYFVVDGDTEAKEIVSRLPSAGKEIVETFGAGILTGNRIDFSALARIVFRSSRDLDRYNGLIMPFLIDYFRERVSSLPEPWVFDGALLPLWRVDEWFDLRIWVDAHRSKRKERLERRMNCDEDEVEKRMSAQEVLLAGMPGSQWVTVPNNGGKSHFFSLLDATMKGWIDR